MGVTIVENWKGVPGARLYDASSVADGPLVGLIAVVHGNEPVGDAVSSRLQTLVETELVRGRLVVIHANLRAFREGVRHTDDGVDLNRLFDRATLSALARMPAESLCYEEARALRIAPLLIECDAVLDMHSTSRPSAPFLLFRDDQRHAAMARKLGVVNMVTGMHESPIVQGGLVSNAGLEPGEATDRLGFTFEAGQHDDPGNRERAWGVLVRMLHELGMWATKPEPLPFEPVVYEVLERFQQAPSGTARWTFVDPAETRTAGSRRRKLQSFETVVADEMLVRRGNTVVRAHSPFTMLMPAPDARPGADLYFIAQRRHGGLSVGAWRTPADARREAIAIERMLDLLGDDEMEEGGSWVSFDNRRCLDLCADLIGRTLRRPAGHPHRRITVVGRGDWGGGEAERRHGQRYRQVMREAILAGVPIDRMQMMRGASLGWLDSMTSVGSWQEEGSVGLNVTLRMSLHQPHTVSLLVVGDLDLAIAEGNTRDCRVAIVIEAATVEPDEDTARVRVVRTGTFSSRPEVLRAARRVINPLRAEHEHMVRETALFEDPALASLVMEDGSLGTSTDRDAIRALRTAVVGMQLKRWANALRTELPEPLDLPNSRALGRWLASVMTRSGILDVENLRKLLIRPSGSGWVADATQLEALAQDPSAEALDRLLRPTGTRASPTQPVVADQVDADNLERWVGWKRYIRGVNRVVGTRGKDLELEFTEVGIRSRLTAWLYEAASRAADAPGEVMVVMAGDGMNPAMATSEVAQSLMAAHRRVLLEPALRYLRIQHAQGTHLQWIKDMAQTLEDRPAGGQPVSVLFEAEHGATVNVVMVCVRAGVTEDWSLDGWSIVNCAMIMSDLSPEAGRHKVALFTENGSAGINQELLHFGRAHCEGLLKQVGWRARFDDTTPPATVVGDLYRAHLARWVESVRSLAGRPIEDVPSNGARPSWVARHLGLADAEVAVALAAAMDSGTPASVVAESLWEPPVTKKATDGPRSSG